MSLLLTYWRPWTVYFDDSAYWVQDATGARIATFHIRNPPTTILGRSPVYTREKARARAVGLSRYPAHVKRLENARRLARANGAYQRRPPLDGPVDGRLAHLARIPAPS